MKFKSYQLLINNHFKVYLFAFDGRKELSPQPFSDFNKSINEKKQRVLNTHVC